MTGNMREDHGMLGRNGIELLAIREPLFRPGGVVPPTSGNPFPRFVMRDSVGNALLHFFGGRHSYQRDGKSFRGRAPQMDVGIIEAGHHKLASEIDGFSAFLAATAIREHVVHFANATDSSLADR